MTESINEVLRTLKEVKANAYQYNYKVRLEQNRKKELLSILSKELI